MSLEDESSLFPELTMPAPHPLIANRCVHRAQQDVMLYRVSSTEDASGLCDHPAKRRRALEEPHE